MRYWITTHWPHPIPDLLPWYIYLKQNRRAQGATVEARDRVFFYESRQVGSGILTHIRKVERIGAEVVSTEVPLREGAGGIVGIATVLRPMEAAAESPRFHYGDGNSWDFEIRCSMPLGGTVVPFSKMQDAIGVRAPAFAFGLYEIKQPTGAVALLKLMGLTERDLR